MNCLNCGTDNQEGAKFCIECGTPFQRRYPSCDFENLARAKFCAECGTSLTEQAPSPSASQTVSQPVVEEDHSSQVEPPQTSVPEAERRQLTVMFCDLVGSTELSGQMDAEDYREVVREYQTTCGDVIERFDCHIAQTLGDGLLIYSGYPVAHENDAERAVRVGLGILDAMITLNECLEQDKNIRLAVRIGIHTGPVVVGEVGARPRQEQLALGEVPNVAARIQGLAEPDTVIISEATHRLIQGYFECETLGEQSLRGVAELVSVYRVLSASDVQNRLDVDSTKGLTPLVGRERDAGLLLDRWEQTKEGQGQVVLLSGESGIGKSRLVQALKDHVIDESHIRWECRSSPYFTNSALYPVIDLIQRTLGWQQDDTPDHRLEKLAQNLSQYRLPLEETVPLFATLLSLPIPEDRYPPLNLTPQRQRQKTLEGILTIILELAEREPVLFILEDLHWTDPSTIELLGLLIEQTPTSRLYAVLTCRPEFQTQWANRSYFTQVTLNRLSRDGIEQIATQVAEGKSLPDDVLQQLIDKTDGVPLYVEEMTKAVLESGMLKEVDRGYELSGPFSSLSIPSTLQDSLMSRLDRLATAKVVAQYASVIGRQFSYGLLQAVSGLGEATLQRELGRLVEAELVYQRGVIPEATYLFKHALIQDTAYESLLISTRQGYHRGVAEILEEQFPDTAETQPELLAHHYTEASLTEQAITYWQRAGDRAGERSAYQEAMSHLTTGITLLQTLPETLGRHQQELPLQTALGTASLIVKGHAAPEVEDAYMRARVLCQELGDAQDVFPVLFGLWRFCIVRPDLPLARQLSEELLGLAKRSDETTLYVLAHYALGWTYINLGEFRPARSHLEAGIARYTPAQRNTSLFRAGQDPGVACRTYAAFTLWFLGYPDQALERAHDALVLATELEHPFSCAFALELASLVYQFRREDQEVYGHAEVAVTLSIEQGFTLWLAMSTFLQGWSLTVLGQSEEGLTQMRQGFTDWRASGAGEFVPYFLALLAESYGELAQSEKGLTVLSESFSLVEKTGECWYEAELHRIRGELLLQQSSDQVPEAESCYNQALEISRNQQAKSLELRASTSLSRLWQSQGKRDEARQLLGHVYGWFTEGLDTADLIDAKALLDELA